jgi:hypothetical protein
MFRVCVRRKMFHLWIVRKRTEADQLQQSVGALRESFKSSIDFTLDGFGAFSEQSLYKKDKENRGRRHNNLIRVGKGKERDNSRPYKSRKGGIATACIRGRLRVKKGRGK